MACMRTNRKLHRRGSRGAHRTMFVNYQADAALSVVSSAYVVEHSGSQTTAFEEIGRDQLDSVPETAALNIGA